LFFSVGVFVALFFCFFGGGGRNAACGPFREHRR
jgi:hypothetical protein